MTPTLEEIRRHFRRETSKLDNWIYHRRIDEYLVQDPDFYDELKEINRQRRAEEITFGECHRLVGDLLRKYQKRDV